jgi:hypothetical protein
MTKELEKKFEKYPLYSQEGKYEEADIVVKYFNPYGMGTWLITEGEKQEDGDWLFFGYCHLYEWEWGYVTLSELESIKSRFGLGIEREMYVTGEKVGDYIDDVLI